MGKRNWTRFAGLRKLLGKCSSGLSKSCTAKRGWPGISTWRAPDMLGTRATPPPRSLGSGKSTSGCCFPLPSLCTACPCLWWSLGDLRSRGNGRGEGDDDQDGGKKGRERKEEEKGGGKERESPTLPYLLGNHSSSCPSPVSQHIKCSPSCVPHLRSLLQKRV